jgi:bifunctional DNase/RNase
VLEAGGEIILIDARPSDSIALAVRAHVPILVARDILETAGITPEEDIQQEIEEEESKQAAVEAGESKERLSIFESFLSNVKLDEDPDSDIFTDTDDDPGQQTKDE